MMVPKTPGKRKRQRQRKRQRLEAAAAARVVVEHQRLLEWQRITDGWEGEPPMFCS
jgi:hypothetical protein